MGTGDSGVERPLDEQVDVIAEALSALRLEGTVYFQAAFCAPWGMAVPAGEHATFHAVVDGTCWLRLANRPPCRLGPGTILLFPHGTAHTLAHAADAPARPAAELLQGLSAASPDGPRFGGNGNTTTLVCGHFSFDRLCDHPLIGSLPDVIHLDADGGDLVQWLATATTLAANEPGKRQRTAAVVVDRLAEALLTQTLRLFLDRNPDHGGFLSAVRDPAVGCALRNLHCNLSFPWSLDALARTANVSRSVLSQRFRARIGESPMRYLLRCRMLEARRLLADPASTLAYVATRIGYQSEFAFSRAFKRFFGHSPRCTRRAG